MIIKLLSILVCLMISGCLLGPNFKHPLPPSVTGYTPEVLPKTMATGKNKQTFNLNQTIPVHWWEIFHSNDLNSLIIQAFNNSPDVKAATARLKLAKEETLTQKASFYPHLQGNFYPTRQLTAGTLASNLASNDYLYSLDTAQLNITYSPDVFGAVRRSVESSKAREETVAFEREAVYLTLSSNIVLTVIQEALLRADIETCKQSIVIAKQMLNLLKTDESLGGSGRAAVLAQETYLAQTQSALPILQKQLMQNRHQLSILCGRFPSDEPKPIFTLKSLTLPHELPLSLPSTLVKNRPDIRAAEAQMHVASAQVGIAMANRLPSLTLSGYGGTNPLNLATLFATGTGYWGVGASLLGPIFEGGALLHQQRAAVAEYQRTASQYRSVVLLAFQQVADTLTAIQQDSTAHALATTEYMIAQKSLSLARQDQKFGATGYLVVLNAAQAYQQSRIHLAQREADRLMDAVALFQALGGGAFTWKKLAC